MKVKEVYLLLFKNACFVKVICGTHDPYYATFGAPSWLGKPKCDNDSEFEVKMAE